MPFAVAAKHVETASSPVMVGPETARVKKFGVFGSGRSEVQRRFFCPWMRLSSSELNTTRAFGLLWDARGVLLFSEAGSHSDAALCASSRRRVYWLTSDHQFVFRALVRWCRVDLEVTLR